MADDTRDQRQGRRIRIVTTHGVVEGTLHVTPLLRTLDELNMEVRSFAHVHDARTVGADWGFVSGELAVNKRSILFVHELSNPPRSDKQFAGRYSRGSMRLRVGSYFVEGFLHTPPGGECLKRLNQNQHDFVSLTSVSVVGPDTQLATPFLAVNRAQVLAAQALSQDVEADGTPLEMSFEVAD